MITVPRVVAPQMSRTSSHRLDRRLDRYSPNTLNKICQIRRKLTNKTRLPSFTRISKNSAKVSLPTRWNRGRVETTKAADISSKSNSLRPFEKTLRFVPIFDFPKELVSRNWYGEGKNEAEASRGNRCCPLPCGLRTTF